MGATEANKRVITKYGNRRLYDKFTSSYISFSDLQKLLLMVLTY
jgi:polyhydroxyalkanoate synthesis regulator protein